MFTFESLIIENLLPIKTEIMVKVTEEQTIKNILYQSVKKYPENSSLSYVNGPDMTYNELDSKVKDVMLLLQQYGITKGDKVAILSRNMPNWGVIYLAITSMGAVVVPILPDFHVNEIENILNHSESKMLFVSDLLYSKVKDISLKELLIKINIETYDVFETIIERNSKNTEIIDYPVSESDLASIIYTSGTTGTSKGVMLTHKNIVFDAKQTLFVEAINQSHSFLSILPLSHSYENTLGFIIPIMQGAAVYYLQKPPTPSILLPALKKIRPTHMLSVPMVIEKIFKAQILPKFQGSIVMRGLYFVPLLRKLFHRIAGKKLYETFGGKMQFFGIGGAKLDPKVERFLREGKFPYAIGYGLTETAPLIAGANAHDVKFQSTGPKMTGIEMKINNPNKKGDGEIWVRGANIMKGYYKEPELTKQVLTEDGWFKTGDLGRFGKNDFLYIRGRIKNMIVGASGENIYPEEIESVINNFKYVVESVVIEQKGKLVALVHFNHEELEKQFNNLKDEAINFVNSKIEELTKELQLYVNSRVNKFSKVYAVIKHPKPFVRTPTQKIKRYLYH